MGSEADIWNWFSAAGDGCYIVDDRCQIVLWNRVAQRLLGCSPEEVLQRYCYEVIRGQGEDGRHFCQPVCAVWQAVIRDASIPSTYLLAHSKDGEGLWLNVSFLRISISPAGGRYIVHLLRDARQEKQALPLARPVFPFIEGHTGPIPDLRRPPSPGPQTFSKRELEVLRLLVRGDDVKTIAGHLSLSPYTIRNHLRNIAGKLGLHSRSELLIYVLKNHLV